MAQIEETQKARIRELESSDLSHLLYDNLPPVEKEFNEKLAELSGYTNGKPKLRVVSGLDPNQTIFAAGKLRRKYVSVRDTIERFDSMKVFNKRTKESSVMLANEAYKKMIINKDLSLTTLGKTNYVVVPFAESEIIEYGIPRYVVEKYRPADSFESPEAWESSRYLEKNDSTNPTGSRIDILGEFPSEGRYEFFCYVEDTLVDNDGQVFTEFKPLTEQTYEEIKKNWILHLELAALSPEKQMEKLIEKGKLKQEEIKNKFEDDLDQMAKSVKNRILGNKQVAVDLDFRNMKKEN